MKTKFTADFETATWLEDETFVWAWAVCEIENEENLIIGNNIDSFMEYCKGQKNSTFYFHNLKFDGEFILYWLLNNGFKHVEKRQDIENNTFTTLISDMGMFYQITVYFEKGNKKTHKVTFIDSLKIIPFSVEQIAKSFNLEISKLKIDYNKPRERNHILTEEEKAYITNDVKIVAKALKVLFDEKLTKMTQGSNALNDFKGMLSFSKFGYYFPLLTTKLIKTLDKAINGGFTYLNPIYKEKEVENVTNLDINSLYPSVMRYCKLPFGEPIFYEGQYKEDNVYDLYIQMITCSFKIKPNHIPTIQIKNSSSFRFNEYLESSSTVDDPNNEECLVLTSVDLKLFLDHYDVKNLKYIAGWKFKSIKGIFDDYIDKWVERKNEATLSGNKGQRTLAKLMLNALYGKFATSLDTQSKIPYLGDDDIVHYALTEPERKNGVYLPMGCFITAYAREKTIRTSQAIKEYSLEKYGQDMYIYSDTDSIKTLLPEEELNQFCEIDDIKLGAWKNEGVADKAKFVRQKCYLEKFGDEIQITCSGMPKTCYKYVEWEKFKTGFTCPRQINI